MLCAKRVSSYFGQVGQLWDTIIGPVCSTLASFFILVEIICFFDVIAPSLSYPIITIPICLLITLNLCMHYFYAATISPGFLDDPPRADSGNSFLWARKAKLDNGKNTMIRGASWSEKGVKITPASTAKCRKCKKLRPERTHHCHMCNKCVLKFDHHCPVRINQCVGLHNERHFVLFMVYVVLATLILIISGFRKFIHAYIHTLGVTYLKWEHIVSEKWFVRAYVSSFVICVAVNTLLASYLHGVLTGATTAESLDNEEYRQEAKERNKEFINSYNCGPWKNLKLFFNIEEGGYSLLTLFLPFRLNPYTDGFSWARKDGYEKYPSFRKAKPRETMPVMTKLHHVSKAPACLARVYPLFPLPFYVPTPLFGQTRILIGKKCG